MNKEEIIKIIIKEIEWCKKNAEDNSKDWRDGFIEGLKQAIRLVNKSK